MPPSKRRRRGAAVDHFTLNDPRYKALGRAGGAPREQLKVVRAVEGKSGTLRTLQTAVPQIDAQLKQYSTSLRDVDWEIAERVADPSHQGVVSSVTYRYVSPDGKLEVRKKYSLEPVAVIDGNPRETRDTQTAGYELKFDLTVVNRDDAPQQADYVLQGPVGLPLEKHRAHQHFSFGAGTAATPTIRKVCRRTIATSSSSR